jgi:hypothetical protein
MNRHQRRARESQGGTTGNILCVVASYSGVSGETVECLDQMKDVALSHGIGFAYKVISRTPIDLARNESLTLVRTTQATAALLVDDDVQIDPKWIVSAAGLLSERLPVLTAPVRLRAERTVFNVDVIELPWLTRNCRVARTTWTGFGAVLISKAVIDQMHNHFSQLHYESHRYPGQTSCALFKSEVATCRVLGEDRDGRKFILDDRVWSLRAQSLKIPIYATVDVDTVHDGRPGNFGKMLDLGILCGRCVGEMKDGFWEIPNGSIFKCNKCGSLTGLVNTYGRT